MLATVTRDRLEQDWPAVEPWLLAVEARTEGRETAAQIRKAIASGAMQCWIWREGDEVTGVALTEIILHSPRCKTLRIRVATGRDRNVWAGDGLAAIENWARELGCRAVDADARVGWKKHLEARGYRVHHLCMGKELTR